jgi:hypothetical protein
MIKAVAENAGQPVVLIGLNEENVKALQMNMPLDVETAELGINDSRVIVFYGKTDEELKDMLEQKGVMVSETTTKRSAVPTDSMVVETGGLNIRLRFGEAAVVLDMDAAQQMVDMVQAKIDRMKEQPNSTVQ